MTKKDIKTLKVLDSDIIDWDNFLREVQTYKTVKIESDSNVAYAISPELFEQYQSLKKAELKEK